MNPPFSITINITEATQCHSAVSQLLRVFPSLSLTITEHEAKSITPGTPQTDSHYYDLAGVSPHCPCQICIAARQVGRLDPDSNAKRTRIEAGRSLDAKATCCSTPGAASGSYSWKPGEHTDGDTALSDPLATPDPFAADAAAAEKEYRLDSSDGDDA